VRTVYGLNFSSPEDANTFAGAMENALEMLRNPAGIYVCSPNASEMDEILSVISTQTEY